MSDMTAFMPSAPKELQLKVLAGVHEGVSIPIEFGEYSIGSVPDADIVLRDDGVAPYHVIIRFEKSDLRVEAVGGDVSLDGETLEGGHGCRIKLPAELTIGDATLRLSREAGQGELADRIPILAYLVNHPGVVAVGAVGVAVVFAAFTVFQSEAPQSGPLSSLSAVTQSPSTVSALGPNGTPGSPSAFAGADATGVADALKEKLAASGIQAMTVSANGAQITISGQISDTQAEGWASVQRWFDQTYAPKFIMTANVAIGQASARPALRLQAVWYGQRPYIITEGGIRYYEGAILDNGWILQQIGEGGVLLRKEQESLTLTFR
ncbi:MAG: hypothetical protein HC850_06880 [Rhodomicrobium sp.]|nr:hypothetical protein [Rhodomicrobium sp.]